jgi:hypothetical protein
MNRLITRPMLRYGLAAMLVSLSLWTWALDPDDFGGSKFQVANYRTQRLKANGELDWRLFGREARSNGPEIHVDGLRITVYRDADTIRIFSGACIIDRTNRLASSSKKVRLISRNMDASGEGFDYDIDKRVFVVRQNVTVRIFDDSVNLLGETGQGAD